MFGPGFKEKQSFEGIHAAEIYSISYSICQHVKVRCITANDEWKMSEKWVCYAVNKPQENSYFPRKYIFFFFAQVVRGMERPPTFLKPLVSQLKGADKKCRNIFNQGRHSV